MTTRSSDTAHGLSAFALKMLAIAAMLVDHIGHIFFADALWMRMIGRLTFPIMAFFIVQGYRHTRNLRRYIIRLLVAAAVSAIPFALAFDNWMRAGNVMLTLALGLMALWAIDHLRPKWLAVTVVVLSYLLSYFGDWGGTGILIILSFGAAQPRQKATHPYTIAVMLYVLVQAALVALQQPSASVWQQVQMTLAYGGACLFALPLINLYNGQRGRDARWLFYGFYPLHLAVLATIRLVMGR